MPLHAIAHVIPGTLRQEVEINDRFRVFTDEPVRLGGDDTASSPHELLPAALAACISTQLVMYARTKGWELGTVAVEVDYDHHSSPRRFQVDIRVGASLTSGQLERLRRVAVTCPVRKALSGGAEFVERIEVGVERAA